MHTHGAGGKNSGQQKAEPVLAADASMSILPPRHSSLPAASVYIHELLKVQFNGPFMVWMAHPSHQMGAPYMKPKKCRFMALSGVPLAFRRNSCRLALQCWSHVLPLGYTDLDNFLPQGETQWSPTDVMYAFWYPYMPFSHSPVAGMSDVAVLEDVSIPLSSSLRGTICLKKGEEALQA